MPLVHISLSAEKSADYARAVADGVHQALVDTFAVPAADRFQVIHRHAPDEIIADPHYPNVERTRDFLCVEVVVGRVRDAATKQAFYERVVELLAERPGLRPDDVMVVVQTTRAEDWSFGRGEMQIASGAAVPARV
jgi:phenylpyruvate tautomerase PptA (4-oxalocrotonate tautomerase family)